MSYATYKLLHLFGLMLTFLALGGSFAQAITGSDDAAARKRFAIGHGIGLLIMFVAGFGMHAKAQIAGFPAWMIGKLVIWALLGAAVMIPRRAPGLASTLWIGIPALGAFAAWLAISKPF